MYLNNYEIDQLKSDLHIRLKLLLDFFNRDRSEKMDNELMWVVLELFEHINFPLERGMICLLTLFQGNFFSCVVDECRSTEDCSKPTTP